MRINADEIQSVHWVPITFFMYDNFVENWKKISYPTVKILYYLRWLKILERSSHYYYLWKKLEEFILGKIYYGGILLPDEMKYNVKGGSEDSYNVHPYSLKKRSSSANLLPYSNKKKPLILWGITLGITSDLVKSLLYILILKLFLDIKYVFVLFYFIYILYITLYLYIYCICKIG